ncbi:hypothetical protein BT63DRAFT_384084 [Microthyrium microscopicum]|uniref:L-tryptophan decarboxylase PsiD-like domain-containing protein n=1 Tax=Microthyrium microscopicum TaxID=703497 RepID=A0A6A6UKZ1_9PEZI|nr:hypothetical protein BT63DRAFT_384084 [Microthyrium microscopicum]
MSNMEQEIPHKHQVHRVGNWLPNDHRVHDKWLSEVIDHVGQNPKNLHPVLQEFEKLIENNTRVYLLVQSMFQQVPKKAPYNKDPTGSFARIKDYKHMLHVLNHLMTTAPTWTDKADRMGMVGLPINAIFDWPMGTPSGFALFLDPEVNAMLKKILNVWGDFLKSPASTYVLENNSNAWFGDFGVSELAKTANLGVGTKTFEELYICDSTQSYHGFKSWDDFFTRLYRPGIRPIASPDNDDVIANACESKTYKVAHNLKARDQFWVKGQPYSVTDMLAQDPLAAQFVGGTIYQAFLSALSYHRWHSPVSGTIVKAFVQDGTYYSEPLFEGLGDAATKTHGIDFHGEATGQGYITAVATRAIIFIKANNPKIGLMAFIGIGMSEVSTCDIQVKDGQTVKKGDELGMFHFGGSSHCLLFRKDVKVGGFPEPGRDHNVPVLSQVAVVEA